MHKTAFAISHVTHIREGAAHSRTLYTSKALDQSNFIILGQKNRHSPRAGRAGNR
jgi:hypothetical protein